MLVSEFLERSAAGLETKTALVCERTRLSYGDINRAANKLANVLLGLGAARQDRVAVYLPNSAEAVISIFGILKAGCVFVVINPQVRPDGLGYILADCGVRAMVTTRALFESARPAVEACPSLERVLLVEEPDGRGGDSRGGRLDPVDFHAALAGSSASPPSRVCIDIDLATVIYTSGSSGRPKGIMLTHLNIFSAAESIIEYLKNTPADIVLSCLPLAFDYGLYQVLMTFRFGGTLVLEKTFGFPYQIVEILKREQVTGFPIVPAMAALLLQLRNPRALELPALRYITSTAQVFPTRHIARLQEIFPRAEIYSMYGLTECKRVSYLPPEELARRPGSVGKAIPNTEAYLVDDEGQVIDTPWTKGELVVRGAHVMKGYWNLPEETAQRLKPGIYAGEYVLHTGDVFQKDEDGFLYFVSRRDDIIKTGGEMVSPMEVENVLYELEDVLEAAVVPVEDEILGSAVRAVVCLGETSRLREDDILRHCSRKLERFKVPRAVDIRYAPLPKTTTGKIAKRELR